jgi:2-polyprenyl-3-methyl-5-hydroxy-6-metoxy-1,4-benzoquinol methylase
MQLELVDRLRFPKTGEPLRLENAEFEEGRVKSGTLTTDSRRDTCRVRDFIPRFVPESNYADNFGMQWNMFRLTQLDSHSGHPISASRFWKSTKWSPNDLKGRWVLDVGCGAGRFAEVALNAGANVVALDYSSAVDACYANLKSYPNLHPVQGDIYNLPFAKSSFDFIYSLGVLQHTPDVRTAFAALPPLLAPRGRLCVDFYQRSWRTRLVPYYWLRPLTKRVPKARLFSILTAAVPRLFAVSRLLGRVPVVGKHLRRVVPVANYEGVLPLSEAQHREWALLDTFDWLAPEFDNPQRPQTIRRWFEASGMTNIEIEVVEHLVGRAIGEGA